MRAFLCNVHIVRAAVVVSGKKPAEAKITRNQADVEREKATAVCGDCRNFESVFLPCR